MRVTRRSARTAAVATGAVAVLLLPAAGAFAADGPGQAPGADATGSSSVFWRNVDLPGGGLAKVYQDGPGRFSAEIYTGGSLVDTLVSTDGQPARGQYEALRVVLRPDGTVSSWQETAPAPQPKPKPDPKPAPKPKPAPRQADARVTLPDGNTARFYKSASWPRVEISRPNGHAVASLDLKHPAAAHHGWTYRLVDTGKHRYELAAVDTPKQGARSSVYDFWGRLIDTYTARKAS
ncbi:hypothetical protein MIU24_09565 [Streptomyces venezuelae]|uniref:hypothetical protein n=1 Tax=Streptomyces sp. B6(2022) TaxID=3404749 RepID=UPI0031201551